MRTFIAVELDEPAREAVSELLHLLSTISGVRWVRPENVHITIRFLGKTSPEVCDLVEGALRDVASRIVPFNVTLGKLGAFPSLGRPRVVWVGIGEGKEELRQIHKRIDERLASMGIPAEERPYTPHITIGRVKRPSRDEKLASISRNSRLASSFVVDKIVFIESKLTPKGPRYRTIYEARMKGVE